METGVWTELLEKFSQALEKSIKIIDKENVDNIPGVKEKLMERLKELQRYLPKENGKILTEAVDNSISRMFFPRTDDFSEAFAQIIEARTHEQDFIINELINGYIASQTKGFGLFYESAVIDKLVEAFKKSNQFRITDQKLFAMFGVKHYQQPSKALLKRIKKIVDFLNLRETEVMVERDLHRGEKKKFKIFTFPDEILEILEGRYVITTEEGNRIITEEFDRNVFVSLFLAKFSVDRLKLDEYKINGICAIFALILILSFMPKVDLDETNPILRDSAFNKDTMSVIPKGWMSKEVIMELLPVTIQIVAYRLGLTVWYDKIKVSDAQKSLHLQSRFLIKDVNKWVLGQLCRVEIPIFVEISNIFQQITIAGDADLDEKS